MTPAAKEETLEEVAHRLVEQVYATKVPTRFVLYSDILSALRNERETRDERAVRLIDEHRAMDVCNDNCWTTIKTAIRGRTE